MKKKLGLILPFIFSIALASAQGFGNFGFVNLFSSFNISMYLTALLFATIFVVIYFILGKTPLGDNTAVRWIVALCAASFSIWGIISSGFSFENFLFRYGISGDILPTVLWMAVVIIALILIAKVGFRNFFAIIFGLGGAVLIALSIFGALYEQGAAILIGVVFLLIGFIIHKKTAGHIGRGMLTGGKGIGRRMKGHSKKLICFIILLLGMALLYFGVTGGELIFMGIGLILLLLGLWCLFRKKRIPEQYTGRVQGYFPGKLPPNVPPQVIEKEKIIYQKRQRSIYDLKQKYIAYGNRFNQVSRSNPQEAKRILQAMDIIIKMTKKQGMKEREFLSNKYIMNYKSVGEIRRKSGY